MLQCSDLPRQFRCACPLEITKFRRFSVFRRRTVGIPLTLIARGHRVSPFVSCRFCGWQFIEYDPQQSLWIFCDPQIGSRIEKHRLRYTKPIKAVKRYTNPIIRSASPQQYSAIPGNREPLRACRYRGAVRARHPPLSVAVATPWRWVCGYPCV